MSATNRHPAPRGWAWMLALTLSAASGSARTLKVGPGQTYATPCKAFAAAQPGDIVEIDAAGNGTYDGDVCGWRVDNLTVRGVNGRARIDAAGKNNAGKGTWTIAGNDNVIENVELSGARVPSRNGAAIRQEGRNLTLRNCYFHDNENGLLTNNPNLGGVNPGNVVIEYSEFANNGYGDGQSHNIYVSFAESFTLRFSYSHHGKVGHLVKTRAAVNYILYNRLSDEDGNASFELDLSNGGTSFVVGNIIEQGPQATNRSLIAYQAEGPGTAPRGNDLYLVNNTIVNRNPLASSIFVRIGSTVTTPPVLQNNIFYGVGTVIMQEGTTPVTPVLNNNLTTRDTAVFANMAGFDFRLASASAAIGMGRIPPPAGTFSLEPKFQYRHPACGETRPTSSGLDAGAYQFGGTPGPVAGPDRCPSPPATTFAVTNAATFQTSPIASGSIISIFGGGMATGVLQSSTVPLPLDLGGTTVRINGIPAPLFYVDPTQINAQVPFEVGPREATAVVSLRGAQVASVNFRVSNPGPGLILVPRTDRAVAQNQDGQLNEPARPAPPGSVLTAYLVGQGPVDPPVATGAAAPGFQEGDVLSRPQLPASATIGPQNAELQFLGLTPGMVGLLQANVLVPALPPGHYPLVVTIGGVASNPGLVVVGVPAAP